MANRKSSIGRVLYKGESERKNGTFQYRYNDPHGERKTVYAKTLSELREKEHEIEVAATTGSRYNCDLKFYDLLTQYLSERRNSLRATTFYHMSVTVEAMKDMPLMNMQIKDIKQVHARRWCAEEADKGLAYGTIYRKLSMFRDAFEMAIADELVWRNPFKFKLSEVVRYTATTRDALSIEDQVRFLQYVKVNASNLYYDITYTLLNTGMRISELLAITVKDIDFDNLSISVNKQVVIIGKKKYITEPKSESGIRTIPISQETADVLKRIIENRKAGRYVVVDGKTDFVFVNMKGIPNKSTIASKYVALTKGYNEKYGTDIKVSAHVLRHTYCTNFSSSGMDLKVLSVTLGHKDTATTSLVYDHVNSQRSRDAYTTSYTNFRRRYAEICADMRISPNGTD